MHTIVLSIDTVIDRLLALSAVRGAIAERDHALVGHRLEAAIRALIPLVVGRLSLQIAANSTLECTDTEIIYVTPENISADTLTMIIISMAQHMLNDTGADSDASLPGDTSLPPPRTCNWY